MIVIDKEHHECQLIDFAIMYGTRADDKEVEDIQKYLELVWSVYSCVWTDYGDLPCKPSYSVRIQENTDKKKLLSFLGFYYHI